jgi:hypothetical protein
MSREEFTKLFEEMRQRMQRNRPNPGPGSGEKKPDAGTADEKKKNPDK